MTAEPAAKNLAALAEGIIELPPTPNASAVQISDLTSDSRDVRPGALFFALRGRNSHGLSFARQAVDGGARAILWEEAPGIQPPAFPAGVYAAPVAKLSQSVGALADRYFDHPSRALRIAGITGTNGKTTCAYLLAASLENLHAACAYLGTLGAGRIHALQDSTHTTVDPVRLHRELAALRAQGARYVAMEVSSHALDQHRAAGVRFESAAFTNLSRDHLDYHGSMQAYGEAKAALFEAAGLAHAVIHWGDEFGRELYARCASKLDVLAVWASDEDAAPDPARNAALEKHARKLFAHHVRPAERGLEFTVDGSEGHGQVRTALLGRFNVDNVVVVLGLLLAFDIPLSDAIRAIEHAAAPPGRMQTVSAPGRALAIVDYAHSPDALAKVLRAAREHTQRHLWCVFGCGGERDAGKRAMMGRVADALADHIIVTDDNPRREPPEKITAEIREGIVAKPAQVIHDRRLAIDTALSKAAVRDVVVIAGKGHERYQIYGERRVPFSDAAEVERVFGAAA